jgi:alpha-mannosidase
VTLTAWSAPDGGKPSFDEAVAHFNSNQQVIGKGFVFGPSWTNHWVKCELNLPEEVRVAGQEVICKSFNLECMMERDGTSHTGLTVLSHNV